MDWGLQQHEYYAYNYLESMELVYPHIWKNFGGGKNSAALIKREPTLEQVAVIVSGGASNGPLFPGFVSEGLADAVVLGGPFAAPNAYFLYEVGKYLGKQKGVLMLYNNFAGDFLNNDMAQELLEMDGIPSIGIAASDDIASAIDEERLKRSGRCSVALLIKVAGSCAGKGYDLKETACIVQRANERTSTLTVNVDFESKKVIYGQGFSGEPGFRTENHIDMYKVAEEIAQMLLKDLNPKRDEKLVVLVNRLRYTAYSDGFLMAKHLHSIISYDYPVVKLRVGNYSNIIDEYGFSVTILCGNDEIMLHLEEDIYADSFLL